MEDILNSPAGEVGGWTTATTAVLLQTANALGVEQINPWLTAALSVGGFIFLVFKIKNMRLRNKILKQELENAKNRHSDEDSE